MDRDDVELRLETVPACGTNKLHHLLRHLRAPARATPVGALRHASVVRIGGRSTSPWHPMVRSIPLGSEADVQRARRFHTACAAEREPAAGARAVTRAGAYEVVLCRSVTAPNWRLRTSSRSAASSVPGRLPWLSQRALQRVGIPLPPGKAAKVIDL